MMDTYLLIFLYGTASIAVVLVALNLFERLRIVISMKSELTLYSKLLKRYEPSSFADSFSHYDSALMQSKYFSGAWNRIKRNLIPPRDNDANHVVRIASDLSEVINDKLARTILSKEGRFVLLPASAFLLIWMSAFLLFTIGILTFMAMPTLGTEGWYALSRSEVAFSSINFAVGLALLGLLLWGLYTAGVGLMRAYLGSAFRDWKDNLDQLLLYTSVQQSQMLAAREFRDCVDMLENVLEKMSTYQHEGSTSKKMRLTAATAGYPRVDDKTLIDYLPRP